jgi:hypothetical protein
MGTRWNPRYGRRAVVRNLPGPPAATSHDQAGCAWAGRRRSLALPYIAAIPETCRPGSSHGNQIASPPIATSNTPTAWPNGFP